MPSSNTVRSSDGPASLTSPCTAVTAEDLLAIARHVSDEASAVSINKHQAVLMAKRFRSMCYNLSQLPNSRPSAAQLTVAASVTELIAELSDEALCVPLLLRQGFTCTAKFRAVSTRLRSVWRLQNTQDWLAEDKAAVEKDEQTAAVELLRRFAPEASHTEVALSRALSDLLFHEPSPGAPSQPALYSPRDPASAPAPGLTRAVTETDVIAWVRRRQLGTWRLPGEALRVEPIVASATDGGDAGLLSTDSVVRRCPSFSFEEGPAERQNGQRGRWYFGACPVWLQTLESGLSNTAAVEAAQAAGTLEAEELAVIAAAFSDAQTQSLMDFVQDAASRTSWCHPHLLTYWGAFTEKYAPAHHEDNDGSGKEGEAASSGPAEICLGMVLSDPRQPAVLAAEDNLARARWTTTSLKTLLFTERRVLPVGECVQLVAQIADALHYMLLGEVDDVPESVLTAWCTVSPANIFITECFAPAAGGKTNKGTRTEEDEEPEEDIFVDGAEDHEPVDVPSASDDTDGTTGQGQLRSRLARYAPPCAVVGIFSLHSRWKPHPQAASPPCYALSQLLLALLTRCPPYRRLLTQAELRNRVFELPEEDPELIADGLPAVKTSRPRGYALPTVLPDPIKVLCTNGLRLISERELADSRHGHRIATSLQQLQQWREQLLRMQADMSAEVWASPLPLAEDRLYGAATTTTAVPVAAEEVPTDLPMRELSGHRGSAAAPATERDYAADWFEYGLPTEDATGV